MPDHDTWRTLEHNVVGFPRRWPNVDVRELVTMSVWLVARSRQLQEHARTLSQNFKRLNEECARRWER